MNTKELCECGHNKESHNANYQGIEDTCDTCKCLSFRPQKEPEKIESPQDIEGDSMETRFKRISMENGLMLGHSHLVWVFDFIAAEIKKEKKEAVEAFRSKAIEAMEKKPIEKAHSYGSENADIYRAFDAGQEKMKAEIIQTLNTI